ncbi:hypothetical protein BJ912DRAFT_926138 [Pholiota molesta]|nr:hypothetical protein BJ912DRAFT_926138 [Pholiota molesta]
MLFLVFPLWDDPDNSDEQCWALLSMKFNRQGCTNMSAAAPAFNRSRSTGAPSLGLPSFPASTSNLSASSSASSKQSARNQGCYGCGNLDHQWQNCKKTKLGDKARMLLERVDEVDASVESLRKVMEDTTVDDEGDGDTEVFARIATDFPFFVESDE